MVSKFSIKLVLFFVVSILLLHACSNDYQYDEYTRFDINLSPIWKFRIGDNQEYKSIKLDDRSWDSISLLDYWSNQRYRNYNGHAWYRIRFKLPSKESFKFVSTDSVLIYVGLINDYYSAYLNGKQLIDLSDPYESNTSMERIDDSSHSYHVRHECKYVISIGDRRLAWGDSNTIAIHVLNMKNDGGFHSDFPPHITVAKEENYIQYDKGNFYDVVNNIYQDSELVVRNIGARKAMGDLIVSTVHTNSDKIDFRHVYKRIGIPPKSAKRITVLLPRTTDPIALRLKFIDNFNNAIQRDSINLPFVISR